MITLPEQVYWLDGALHGYEDDLRRAKMSANYEGAEQAQRNCDHALAVMATLLATINAQQAVKTPRPA